MNDPILVINCGSSSIKYALVPVGADEPRLSGIVERLGGHDARLTARDQRGQRLTLELPRANHASALKTIFETLGGQRPIAIGHRVVHGGERFTDATLLDDTVIRTVRQMINLAPLHNPANLDGITIARRLFTGLPQVAVFDTAFHQTLPDYAYRYAVPAEWYDKHAIRRYGFHGTSHAYIAGRLAKVSPNGRGGWVIAHLGNGCSATAVHAGKSLDTSMGLTPLEGLVMGTRCGDVDPGLPHHLAQRFGWSMEHIERLFNQKSGLLGLSELSNDMRELEHAEAQGHQGAKLAIEVFCYRLAKSIASLSCALPSFDGVAFTGGIGENSATIRARTLAYLGNVDLMLSTSANQQLPRGAEGRIDTGQGRELWVIPTDEEGHIAAETRRLLEDLKRHDEVSAKIIEDLS